jgi:hypothetical protein
MDHQWGNPALGTQEITKASEIETSSINELEAAKKKKRKG